MLGVNFGELQKKKKTEFEPSGMRMEREQKTSSLSFHNDAKRHTHPAIHTNEGEKSVHFGFRMDRLGVVRFIDMCIAHGIVANATRPRKN